MQAQHQRSPPLCGLELIKWVYFTVRTELLRHPQPHAWTSSPEYCKYLKSDTPRNERSLSPAPISTPICTSCFPSSVHGPPLPSHPRGKPSSAHRRLLHPNPVIVRFSQFPLTVSTLTALTSQMVRSSSFLSRTTRPNGLPLLPTVSPELRTVPLSS